MRLQEHLAPRLPGEYFTHLSIAGRPVPLDGLTFARLFCCAVATLLIPVAFLSARHYLGTPRALILSLLITFSPLHLSLSRLAHLDAILALFATLSVFALFRHLERPTAKTALNAGLWWGLALLTKPTVVALAVAAAGYRLVTSVRNKQWSFTRWDLLAVLTGHVVLVLCFTRLWPHKSDYAVRLAIHSRLADYTYLAGSLLRANTTLTSIATVVLGMLACRIRRGSIGRLTLGTAAVFVALLRTIPAVFENIIRFWTWVLGLSKMEHVSFHGVVPSLPLGYGELFVDFLPPLVAVGTVVFLMLFIVRHITTAGWSRRKDRFLLFLLMCALVWIGLLQCSHKQALRYAAPVLPILYTFALEGMASGGTVLSRLSRTLSHSLTPPTRRRTLELTAGFPAVSRLSSTLLLASVIYASFSVAPHYELYYSSFAGAPQDLVDRQVIRPRAGINPVLARLKMRSAEIQDTLRVAVEGDSNILEKQMERLYGPEQRYAAFSFYLPREADVLVDLDGTRELSKRYAVFGGRVPGFQLMYQGIRVSRMWEIPPPSYESPLTVGLRMGHVYGGKLHSLEGPVPPEAYSSAGARSNVAPIADSSVDSKQKHYELVMSAGKDAPGVIFRSTLPLRMVSGSYTIRLKVSAKADERNKSAALPDPAAPLLRVELGAECSRVFYLGELTAGQPPSFSCTLPAPVRTYVEVWWLGTASIRYKAIEVSARGSNRAEISAEF